MNQGAEGIDFEKLVTTLRKNVTWMVAIFIVTNLISYLSIRWTKDIYESYSELKLDVKQEATALGIKSLADDQNLNLVSGEIEQIKSKLFFNRVIDSMDLRVSYYSIGKILNDEMYKRPPFKVSFEPLSPPLEDTPIFFNFSGKDQFQLRVDKDGLRIDGTLGHPFTLKGTTLIISANAETAPGDENDYFFVINSRAKLLEYLAGNIQVDPLNFNANTIRISFQDHNARKAYDIVNKIDTVYLGYSYEQKNLANTQKIDWLNRELTQIEKKMEGFEDYIETFTLQNKSNDVDDDLKKTVLLINKVDSQRFELNKRIKELDVLIDDLNANAVSRIYTHQLFLPAYLNQEIETLQEKILAQSKLGLAYNENTFAFRQKEGELKTLRSSIFQQLSALKEGWFKTYTELGIRKDRLEREFAQMPDKNTQFSKQQRFYKLHEELYLTMMQSKAQFEITQAGTTPDFKILSSANLPHSPIAPKKYVILLAGLIAGFVLNFFFIGVLYISNNRIQSIREIEQAIQVPVLGSIPASDHASETPFHIIDNPKSMVSEAIRTLRSNLDFFSTNGQRKVIAISSTISGEGKSFLAINLGGVLALSKKKVVLLNLDMRKQKPLVQELSGDSGKGISTILIKKHTWKESIIKTAIDNFDYIPSGPHPPNPSELLLNGEFSLLLDELKKEYDYIVLDTPPIGLVTDGTMAMRRADLCIYVFRANYSKKSFIETLTRIIAINKFTNLAVVINAVPVSAKVKGYGYYEDRTSGKSKFRKLINL